MLVLNQKQIKKLIPLRKIKEVIDWVERAFYDYENKNIQCHQRLIYILKNIMEI